MYWYICRWSTCTRPGWHVFHVTFWYKVFALKPIGKFSSSNCWSDFRFTVIFIVWVGQVKMEVAAISWFLVVWHRYNSSFWQGSFSVRLVHGIRLNSHSKMLGFLLIWSSGLHFWKTTTTESWLNFVPLIEDSTCHRGRNCQKKRW